MSYSQRLADGAGATRGGELAGVRGRVGEKKERGRGAGQVPGLRARWACCCRVATAGWAALLLLWPSSYSLIFFKQKNKEKKH